MDGWMDGWIVNGSKERGGHVVVIVRRKIYNQKKKAPKKSNIFAHFKADQVCSLPDRVCLNECVLLLVVEQFRERRK